uniref:Succinate dehydrogenase cytochrome b560 subunit, mitochondrial n=1 Tax=Zeugodacus cucurbitae TaxID=28588 RepID=A0A0A1WPS4_ZEUCU
MLSRSCAHFNLCKLYVRTLRTVPSQQMKIKTIPPKQKENYETKNRRLGRFISPSLSIYKPQLTSVMSISNRACSILLTLYTWGLGIGALISSHDNAHFVTMLDGLQLGSTSLFILKFLIAFPFSYHLCGGIRVLIWETGSFLSLKGIYGTGYVALVTTILTTIGLASL